MRDAIRYCLTIPRFSHILIDDIQEFSELHFEFLKKILSVNTETVTIFADDDQAIARKGSTAFNHFLMSCRRRSGCL